MSQVSQANFTPTKRFFVDMLTRDIDLEDAILDLLDNCLDGVTRSQKKDPDEIDYNGYWVKIKFDKNSFTIEDNCGGIPIDSAAYAFRMGRPKDAPQENLATVGVYGIGMKRSIFKIGRHCKISTAHSDSDSFSVEIDEDWLNSDHDWEIPIQPSLVRENEHGTKIEITKVQKDIANQFKHSSFQSTLINKIVFAYSYIIDKGFTVKVNDEPINPMPVSMRYERVDTQGKAIQPYIFKGEIDGVDVKLIVGFYSPLPSENEEENDKQQARHNTRDAGWTIVCNDRIVVFKDKTELTGWGSDYARYHTQFIAISGIVYFKSKYPEKLPITTTKRGVDISSPLFLKVRKHMVEGTKLFIDYTNKWKGQELISESNSRLIKSEVASPLKVIEEFSNVPEKWTKVRNRATESKFKPTLPVPKNIESNKRISFQKSLEKVEVVCEYLNLDSDATPNQIGESCFDFVYTEATK